MYSVKRFIPSAPSLASSITPCISATSAAADRSPIPHMSVVMGIGLGGAYVLRAIGAWGMDESRRRVENLMFFIHIL